MPLLTSRLLWYLLALIGMYAAGWFSGYEHEHRKFVDYKSQVEAQAKAAEDRAKEIEARHEADKREIEEDYKTRLANLQRRYADSLRKSGGGQMPKPADAPRRLDEAARHSDPYFVEQCAETTLQLIELQNWIKRTQR